MSKGGLGIEAGLSRRFKTLMRHNGTGGIAVPIFSVRGGGEERPAAAQGRPRLKGEAEGEVARPTAGSAVLNLERRFSGAENRCRVLSRFPMCFSDQTFHLVIDRSELAGLPDLRAGFRPKMSGKFLEKDLCAADHPESATGEARLSPFGGLFVDATDAVPEKSENGFRQVVLETVTLNDAKCLCESREVGNGRPGADRGRVVPGNVREGEGINLCGRSETGQPATAQRRQVLSHPVHLDDISA